jgi:hypothetical protein
VTAPLPRPRPAHEAQRGGQEIRLVRANSREAQARRPEPQLSSVYRQHTPLPGEQKKPEASEANNAKATKKRKLDAKEARLENTWTRELITESAQNRRGDNGGV